MKPILEVTLQDWALTRDKLLDTFVKKTGDTEYPTWFMSKVWQELNLDLSRKTPYHQDSLDSALREISVMRSVIEDIDEFLFEIVDGERVSCEELYDEYDPYCEDIYHDDDPRLF